MNWTFVGYFPRRRMTRSTWASPYPEYPDAQFPAPVPVEEICSVSDCIAKGPELRTDQVPCNEFGGYAAPAAAWEAVPATQRQDFDLFAFRFAHVLFQDGQLEPLEFPALELAPLSDDFELLGYDAVELTFNQCLGCSPLSCNGQTGTAKLNRYCLVASEAEGAGLARSFSVSKPEPGPYALAEVWREHRDRTGPPTSQDLEGSASDRT